LKSFCNERGRNAQKQKPRIISDNGPQFIARDFKEFIRIAGMTNVRTSPYYPQSNGKLGALAQNAKIGVHPPWHTVDKGKRVASDSNLRGSLQHRTVAQRNRIRDAQDMLAGRQKQIHSSRDQKLEEARQRKIRRQRAGMRF
jgi:putative transposase